MSIIIAGKRLKDDLVANWTLDVPFEKKPIVVVVEGSKRTLGIGATESDDVLRNRLFVDTDYTEDESKGLFCDAVKVEDNGSVHFLITDRNEIKTLGTASVGKLIAFWDIREDANGNTIALKHIFTKGKE